MSLLLETLKRAEDIRRRKGMDPGSLRGEHRETPPDHALANVAVDLQKTIAQIHAEYAEAGIDDDSSKFTEEGGEAIQFEAEPAAAEIDDDSPKFTGEGSESIQFEAEPAAAEIDDGSSQFTEEGSEVIGSGGQPAAGIRPDEGAMPTPEEIESYDAVDVRFSEDDYEPNFEMAFDDETVMFAGVHQTPSGAAVESARNLTATAGEPALNKVYAKSATRSQAPPDTLAWPSSAAKSDPDKTIFVFEPIEQDDEPSVTPPASEAESAGLSMVNDPAPTAEAAMPHVEPLARSMSEPVILVRPEPVEEPAEEVGGVETVVKRHTSSYSMKNLAIVAMLLSGLGMGGYYVNEIFAPMDLLSQAMAPTSQPPAAAPGSKRTLAKPSAQNHPGNAPQTANRQQSAPPRADSPSQVAGVLSPPPPLGQSAPPPLGQSAPPPLGQSAPPSLGQAAPTPPSQAAPLPLGQVAPTPVATQAPPKDVVAVVKPQPSSEPSLAVPPNSAPTPDMLAGEVAKPIQIKKKSDVAALAAKMNRASLLFQNGDLNQAEQIFRQVLTVAPRNHRAMIGLASVAMRRGQEDVAQRLYRRVLATDPKNSIALAGLVGSSGSTDPSYEESRLKGLLNEFPEGAHIYFALGGVYAAQQRWPEAYSAFLNASRVNQNNPEILFNLAVSLDHMGRFTEALADYRQAVAMAAMKVVNFDVEAVHRRMAALEKGSH